MKPTLTPLERLIASRIIVVRHFEGSLVPPDSPCWESTYKARVQGYVVIGNGKGSIEYAHRIAYERFVGELEKGRQIDHLCRNRECWNPSHLELVTQKVNIERGMSPGANAVRTNLCKRGHSLDDAYVNAKGHRTCRSCFNAYQLERYHGMKNGTWIPLTKRKP